MMQVLAAALIGVAAVFGSVTVAGPADNSIVLTVSGQIDDGSATLDRQTLAAMGTAEFHTSTAWTTGVQRFEGVPLAAVLAGLGAQGGTVRATALNEYAVDIPMAEITQNAPLLALRMNGVDLSPRDKGPIWVVYPFDSSPDLQTATIRSRSIWQVTRLEVLP